MANPDDTILVRATQLGFANNARVRPGQTFRIPMAQFSERWMVRAEPDAIDELEKARQLSPKQHGPGGVELKAKPKTPPGSRRGLEPDTGI